MCFSARRIAVLFALLLALTDTPAHGESYADYIATNSRYGWKAVCVSNIETGGWTAFYNPVAWHGEHAQGFFGWLPSTFYGIAQWGAIMDLDAEIEAFDRMLDAHRGGEFYGLGGYAGIDGTGPCYRR
jgi:hypothetical protein